MRAVVQRTIRSSVSVDGQIVGKAGFGLTVLLGVGKEDTEEDALYLAEKIVNLRIFPDTEGKMNVSLKEQGGDLLVISQFTLFGDCRKGRRPGFDQAARPDQANKLYEHFIHVGRLSGCTVESGQFQADMVVSLENQGPVTILLDSKRIF